MTYPSVKDELADYLDEQATWRYMKAEEYPEDVRNQRASDALSALAHNVRGLADDHDALVSIGRLCEETGLEVEAVLPRDRGESGVDPSRFRFNDPGELAGEFLERLAEGAWRQYTAAIEDGA